MAILTTKTSIDTTWADVQDNINYGNASFYTPGDIITDTLADGRKFPFAVAAVNHYQQDEVIFTFAESLCRRPMNKKDTNKGGWGASDLRKFANGEALALMPEDLQKVIAPVTIVETQSDGTRTSCTDKLWVPSVMEVSGEWPWEEQENGVDKQFPYYAVPGNRIVRDGSGAVCGWRERSALISYTHYFYFVSTSGGPYYYSYAGIRFGVVLGFAIRKSV